MKHPDVEDKQALAPAYPRIAIPRRIGNEPFHKSQTPLGYDLLSFWQWATSDLISNSMRGVLAEFIVSQALGLEATVRAPWDPYDLRTPEGVLIEVKSSAYLQSWHQKKLSRPTFTIRQTRAWYDLTNELDGNPRHQSHVYVFALLHGEDKQKLDPLDVDQWKFYVLPTSVLASKCPMQKTIGLPGLKALGAKETTYNSLKDMVSLLAQTPS